MDDSEEERALVRVKKGKKRKQKVILTFNEEERRDYLNGFRKRKLQRKETAKRASEKKEREQKRQEVKEKRSKIKDRVKELIDSGILPADNEEPSLFEGKSDTHDFGTHEVIITSALNLSSTGIILGQNEGHASCEEEDKKGKDQCVSRRDGVAFKKTKKDRASGPKNKHFQGAFRSHKKGRRR